MNLKRIFGAVLTTIGIIILCYGAYLFINSTSAATGWKTITVSMLLGLVFFASGIGLIKGMKDQA